MLSQVNDNNPSQGFLSRSETLSFFADGLTWHSSFGSRLHQGVFRHLYAKQMYRLNSGLNMQFSGDLLCSWIMNNVRLPLTGGLKRKM